MGTRYDCFHEKSHTASAKISDHSRKNRLILQRLMVAEGFHNYPREWWHFSIGGQGFEREHDFPVD
jgi:D-alanyl-D-alanine dipeptidase